MSIKDLISSVSRTRWELTDDFVIFLTHRNIDFPDSKTLQKYIISVNIPELTASEFDEVFGGERRVGVKQFEAFRFTVRFRDIDGLELRKKFIQIFASQQYLYPDLCSFDIVITDQSQNVLFTSVGCLITNVSSIEFNNSTTAIAEFDVQFISNNYSDDSIPMFGTSDFGDAIDKVASNKGYNL